MDVKSAEQKADGFFQKVAKFVGRHPKTSIALVVAAVIVYFVVKATV